MARVGGVEDGVDYGHVPDRVFDGDRDFSAFQNGFGEGIALQGVLIAGGEGLCSDAAAEQISTVVDKEASGTIHRCVEGNLNLDAPMCAKEVDTLVRNQLRTASEDGLAAGEVENR